MAHARQQAGEVMHSDLVWAESPRWRDGVLWISDTQASRLVVIDGTDVRVHSLDSPVNGTAFLGNGELVAARMTGARIDRFDGERWELHADLSELGAGQLGDMTALSDGTIYVDDLGSQGHDGKVSDSGRLLKVDAGGGATVAAEGLIFPNGLALIDGGGTLIVGETFASRLTAFTLGSNGELSGRRLWIDLGRELGPEHRPDGLWPTRDGSVWVATATGEAFVRVREGEVVERLDVDGFAIACCLDDYERDLYATVANSIDPARPVLDAVAEKQVRARVERYGRGDAQAHALGGEPDG
jgi:sugar lactone lactonase YvrE